LFVESLYAPPPRLVYVSPVDSLSYSNTHKFCFCDVFLPSFCGGVITVGVVPSFSSYYIQPFFQVLLLEVLWVPSTPHFGIISLVSVPGPPPPRRPILPLPPLPVFPISSAALLLSPFRSCLASFARRLFCGTAGRHSVGPWRPPIMLHPGRFLFLFDLPPRGDDRSIQCLFSGSSFTEHSTFTFGTPRLSHP